MKKIVEDLLGKCETLAGHCLRFAAGEDITAAEKLACELPMELGGLRMCRGGTQGMLSRPCGQRSRPGLSRRIRRPRC